MYSPNAREVAMDVLLRVKEEGAYSNIVLNAALKQTHLSVGDRALVTEIVYGTITWQKKLDYIVGKFVKGKLNKLENWVLVLLQLSFYQLLFLERIPSYAVVNEAVKIAKKRGHKGITSVVNGVLRSYLRDPQKILIPQDLSIIDKISLQYSHPKWLVERWLQAFGEQATEQICIANNTPEKVTIRTNPLKTSRDDLLARLEQEDIQAVPSDAYEYSIHILSKGNLTATKSYQEGLYTIQDESSMFVGHLLNPLPRMHVLDACAAPGGKTTHIAELMGNKGTVIANDLHAHKQRLIQEQSKRLGISIIETIVDDARHLSELSTGLFDRILLDAPCTGFGVIRKKPDIKWRKSVHDIRSITYVQYELLSNLSRLLKKDGKMIYSTCTIENEENQKMMERFILDNPQFKLDESLIDDLPSQALKELVTVPGMVQILPHHFGTDGFFIARIMYA